MTVELNHFEEMQKIEWKEQQKKLGYRHATCGKEGQVSLECSPISNAQQAAINKQ